MTKQRTLYHREYYRENRATTGHTHKTKPVEHEGLSEAEIQWCNEQSFRNLVRFFSAELLRLHKTGKVMGLSCATRRRLKQGDLIVCVKIRRFSYWRLTPRCKEVLGID